MFGKFFGKKDTPQSQSQSQSMSGVNVNGGQVQQAQAGRDGTAAQQGQMQTQQQGMSGAEVVALLGNLKGTIVSSGISDEQKEDLLDYLKAVTKEAGKDAPDKEFAKTNLKKMADGMKTLNDTSEAGKGLWKTGLDVFNAVAPWVGVAATFFGG
jgi:hypothetical protein